MLAIMYQMEPGLQEWCVADYFLLLSSYQPVIHCFRSLLLPLKLEQSEVQHGVG